MSLLEMVPDRILGDMGCQDDDPSRERRPLRVPVGAEPVGRDSGAAIGSAINQLVQMSDREIAANNRLTMLMQQHRRWAAKKQHEVEQMARQTQGCEGCGKVKALSMCSGELLCSTCASLSGVLSKDPGVIAKRAIKRDVAEALLGQLIEQKGGDWFTRQAQQYLPEEIKVDLGKGPLDAIAELVGYVGDDADGLVDAVGKVVYSANISGEALEQMGIDSIEALKTIADRLVAAEGLLRVVGDAVGVELMDTPNVLAAVLHTEAILEDILRSTNQALDLDLSVPQLVHYIHLQRQAAVDHADFMLRLRQIMDSFIAPVDDLLEQINQAKVNADGFATLYQSKVDELTLVTDQLADAERRLAATPSISCQACDDKDAIDQIINHLSLDTDATHAEVVEAVADLLQNHLLNEQVFARVRDIIGDDTMPIGDLPSAIESLGYAVDGPYPRPQTSATLDSQLLDIVLSHPQVPLEHVAAIREAA